MKVVDPETGSRSITHFYRDCEVWPRLDPMTVIFKSTSPSQAIRASSSSKEGKKRLMGGNNGDGALHLAAELSRSTWVAGQPLHVSLRISNRTAKKTVKSVYLMLIRTTTVFKPSALLGSSREGIAVLSSEEDSCETATTEKRIAEEVLSVGQRGSAKGRHVSAKGWWLGAQPGERSDLVHAIVIPVSVCLLYKWLD